MTRGKRGGGRLHVEVTQRDIDWGIREDSGRCVVARAVARSIPDASRIEVDTQTVRFTSGGKRWAFLTPLVVQQYVADFDAGQPIVPFQFWLRSAIQLRRRLLDEDSKPAYRESSKQRHQGQQAIKEAKLNGQPITPEAQAAAHASRAGTHTTNTEGRVAPPRVFKAKRRMYGARILRINQPQQQQSEDDRFEADVRAMVRILDDLHVPDDANRVMAERALRRHNVKRGHHGTSGHTVVDHAIRIRRQRHVADVLDDSDE